MTVRPRFLLFLSAVFFFSGCSTTKDKWLNIKYHETTARFNAFFNGEEAFNEAVVQFEKTEELDFENLLPIYYWPDEKQATALFAKMDRALEKSAIVIKKHSMVFRGEQRNDYVVKAYLLIAKARFYKHELIQCIEATSYMADQFGGVEKAQDELFWAKLLAAQTHIRMGNGFQAEYLLDEIYTVKLPKDQLFEAQKTYAAYFISTGKYTEAQKWVALAAAGAPNKSQKVRLTYLNAQLLAKNGQGYESALAYEEVLKLHPDNYDITFSAQIKRAENFDVFMEDVAVIEKDLEKMLRDDKNLTYRDQIYYVWALKQLDLEHYPEAEGLLGKSIRYSVNNPKQKGKSYLKLAGISFDFKEFVPAQAYYDSAITALPAGYGGLDTLVERKSVLDELVAAINTIALEDSLQALYGMSEQDLRAKFESYIEKKKEQEAAAARAAELSALRAEQNALLADAGPQAGGGSGEWYFFNPSVRAGGVAAFKKKWGDRVLEDHWRTKDKPLQGLGSIAQEVATVEEEDTLKIALPSDDNQVEYYLARTLQSEQDLKKSLAREAEAKSELGFIYKDGLKDLKGADLAWIDYLSAFEGYAQYTPKVLYGIYLLRGEELDTERQETTRQTLLKNYPNSPYAALLRGEFKGPAIPLEEQAAYDLAVDAYSMGQTKTAKKQLDTFLKSYPKSALLPKASLLDAFLTGASGSAELVIEKLQQVVKEYAGTEEATRATQILSLLQDDGQEDTAGTLGKGDQKVQRMEFTEQANAPHKIILAIPAENAKINELRNALADFNKEHFKFDNLRIQNIFYDEYTQLIIISGLRTKEKAVVYLNTINELGASLEQYYPAQSSELFYIDNANFGKVYRDKVLKEYLQYFKSK